MSVSTSSYEERFPNGAAVLRLCLGMTLLFTAFQEVQNFAPQEMKEAGLGNLGFYALATLYSCNLVGIQVTPWQMKRLGAPAALALSACGVAIFIGILLAAPRLGGGQDVVIATLGATIFGGLMAGPMFPAASSLLTHYAPQRYLNWYMSVFSLFVYTSGLLGPAVISLVLRCSSQPLVPPLMLAALAGLGLLLLLGLPAPEMAPSSATTRWPFALLRERPVMCLAVLGFAEGWCTNAWVAFVLPILTRTWAMPEHFKDQYQLVLLLNGLGHLVASLVYAPVADRCGRRWVLVFQSFTGLIAVLLSELEEQLPQTQSLALPGAFLVGFTLILARINTNAICGYRYSEHAGSAFTLLASLRAIGSILGMALMPMLGNDVSVCSLACLPLASIIAALHKPLHAAAAATAKGGEEEPESEP